MTHPTTGAAWTANDVISVVRELAREGDLPEHLIEGKIGEGDSVASLGIDSLGGVYLIERLEEMTGVLIPDDFIDLNTSIGEITTRLSGLIEEQK